MAGDWRRLACRWGSFPMRPHAWPALHAVLLVRSNTDLNLARSAMEPLTMVAEVALNALQTGWVRGGGRAEGQQCGVRDRTGSYITGQP